MSTISTTSTPLHKLTIHQLGTQQSERILWLCEDLGTSYEIKRYERDAVTRLAAPELKKIDPLGNVPVITDRDLVLAEPGAIALYLIAKHGGGPPTTSTSNRRPRDRRRSPAGGPRYVFAQAEPQRQATKPGLAVRGTFSAARAWCRAVGFRLARTLGVTEDARRPTSKRCRADVFLCVQSDSCASPSIQPRMIAMYGCADCPSSRPQTSHSTLHCSVSMSVRSTTRHDSLPWVCSVIEYTCCASPRRWMAFASSASARLTHER